MSALLNFLKTYTPFNILREIFYRYISFRDHALKVGRFYDTYHEDFLEVYGELIQAFRTHDIAEILDYELESIDITDDMQVLDAGCGVGKPALYFASRTKAHFQAISISKRQIDYANKLKEQANISQVEFTLLDYHSVDQHFASQTFDRVYFLESFGHSRAKEQLLQSVWNVLKPGGELYVKDLFRRVSSNRKDQKKIIREIRKINQQYHYEVADLNTFLTTARRMGFVLKMVRTVDIKLESFENLTISNKFQELTGIYKIESFEDYIFPVDFMEVKLYKPAFNMEEGKDKYFLQNLVYQNQHR